MYELCDYFMETENMSETEAIKHINNGGYKIYLTVDLKMQEHVEAKYANWDVFIPQINEYDEPIQSSFIAMDYTGGVLAVVGGIGDKNVYGDLCFNRAVQSKRDPGSTIKSVTSYGAAMYYDQAYFSQIYKDSMITLPDGSKWPRNYEGYVTDTDNYLYYCLQRSMNTIPAQFVQNMGVQKVYEFSTQRLGLDLEPTDEDYAPLTIGAMTHGITLEDLVNAYMPYGNAGMFYDSHIISNVQTGDGKLLYSNSGKGTQAVDPDTAYVMNKMLQMVVNNSGGTALGAQLENKVVAGKTGTSDDFYDLLFVGLTEDFVSGVWFGFDTRAYVDKPNLSSSEKWNVIVGDFAETYNTGRSFPENDNVIKAKFCKTTGKIAGPNCKDVSDIYGYYKPSNAPYCDGNHPAPPATTTTP
jgi:penicillin-binding protein 1A